MKVWSIYLATETKQDAVTREWRPAVDIYRRPNEWLLKFDLAGVRPDDAQVRIAGSRITVSGVRRDWLMELGYSYHSMEISYNRFERTIELPEDLPGAEYSLEARDGFLLVRVRYEGKSEGY
jgi:HSP20 family protein